MFILSSIKIQRHYRAPVHVEAIPVPPRRFTHVHVDIVGPLPTSRGYTYLPTILDRTTRWPEAVPLQDITAASFARAFMTGWVARFGVPLTVVASSSHHYGPRWHAPLGHNFIEPHPITLKLMGW